MTTAKLAEPSDVPAILAMCEVMHDESRYVKYHRDMAKVELRVRGLIDNPSGIVLATPHGFLLGGISEYWFGSALYAFQYLLYVAPEARGSSQAGALVRAYIERAKELGAVDIHIENTTGVETESVERFFSRCGFTRVGGNFIMEV